MEAAITLPVVTRTAVGCTCVHPRQVRTHRIAPAP